MAAGDAHVSCSVEPGRYDASEFRSWRGWVLHLSGRRPLHDLTGTEFRWNHAKAEPEPVPIRLPVFGGHAGLDALGDAAADLEQEWSWQVPSPGDYDSVVDEHVRAGLRRADESELRAALTGESDR